MTIDKSVLIDWMTGRLPQSDRFYIDYMRLHVGRQYREALIQLMTLATQEAASANELLAGRGEDNEPSDAPSSPFIRPRDLRSGRRILTWSDAAAAPSAPDSF